MHSSWYSRRRIEVTSSGALAGAKVASLRTPIDDIKFGRNLRHATKLGGSRCIPHIARVNIGCERDCRTEGTKKTFVRVPYERLRYLATSLGNRAEAWQELPG